MTMTLPTAIRLSLAVTSAVVFVLALTVMAVPLAVVRGVIVVIPVVAHKIDRAIAGVVLVAMHFPVFGMSTAHTQIERCCLIALTDDHHRLVVEQARTRRIADVDATVKVGLAN